MLTSDSSGADGKARGLLAKVSPWEVGQPVTLLTIVKVGGRTLRGASRECRESHMSGLLRIVSFRSQVVSD